MKTLLMILGLFASVFTFAHELHDAVRKNDIAQLSWLLADNDIDVNSINKSGFTALHFAAAYNYADIARLLIQKGADVNFVAEKIDYYEYNGKICELRDETKIRTPLQLAAEYKSLQVAEILVQAGADVNKNMGYLRGLPIDYAMKVNAFDIVKLLIPYTKNLSQTIVLWAAQNNQYEIVKMLIAAGVNVNYRSGFGIKMIDDFQYLKSRRTALHYAVENNNVHIVALLLQAGALKNIKDANKQTCLDLATTQDMKSVLKHIGVGKKK